MPIGDAPEFSLPRCYAPGVRAIARRGSPGRWCCQSMISFGWMHGIAVAQTVSGAVGAPAGGRVELGAKLFDAMFEVAVSLSQLCHTIAAVAPAPRCPRLDSRTGRS